MNKTNMSFYQTPTKQKSQTSRMNSSLIDFHTPAGSNTQPDDLEYYSVPKNYTVRVSKRDRFPTHYGNELSTRITDNYNSMESSFYKYVRSMSNQQRIYDESNQKNKEKMIKLNTMIKKCSNNKSLNDEKKQIKARSFLKHSEEINQKFQEINQDMLKLQTTQIQELKNKQMEFIKKKEENQSIQFAIRIPQDQRISHIRQKNRVEEQNNQLDINEENGEKLKERLYIADQRYEKIMKNKIFKIQKSNERLEKIKKQAELKNQFASDYYVSKIAKQLENSVKNKNQVNTNLEKTFQKKRQNDMEKTNTVKENRDNMHQTFTDKLHNCSCTSKANSPKKYFKLTSRMSVDDKMLQVSINKQSLRESRERHNQDILDRHTQYSLTNSLSRTTGTNMNNFRRRANFLTKEDFQIKY